MLTLQRQSANSGALGVVRPGDVYLLRFQNRIAWIQVIESVLMYHRIVIKGLELQETSCHTEEATSIDTMFQLAFEDENPRWITSTKVPLKQSQYERLTYDMMVGSRKHIDAHRLI